MERHLPGSEIFVVNELRMGVIVAMNRLAAKTNCMPIIIMYSTSFLMAQIGDDPWLKAYAKSLKYDRRVFAKPGSSLLPRP